MNIDTLIPVYDEKKRLTPPELFEEIINTVRQIFFTDKTKRYVFRRKTEPRLLLGRTVSMVQQREDSRFRI